MTKQSSAASLSPFARFPSDDVPCRSGSYMQLAMHISRMAPSAGDCPARCCFGMLYKSYAHAAGAKLDLPHAEALPDLAPFRDSFADNFRFASSSHFQAVTRDTGWEIGNAETTRLTL